MNLIDAVELIKPFIDKLFKEGVKCSDLNYIDMLIEYSKLTKERNKKTWIFEHLSQKYNLSTSQIQRITRRLENDL